MSRLKTQFLKTTKVDVKSNYCLSPETGLVSDARLYSNLVRQFSTVYESEVAIHKKWFKGLAIEIVFNTD